MVASRIRRIAAGAGVHPKEVMMLLQVHKQFEGMVGKSKGFFGKGAQAKQQQMAAQMQKNPKLIQQRLNQMVGYYKVHSSVVGSKLVCSLKILVFLSLY